MTCIEEHLNGSDPIARCHPGRKLCGHYPSTKMRRLYHGWCLQGFKFIYAHIYIYIYIYYTYYKSAKEWATQY